MEPKYIDLIREKTKESLFSIKKVALDRAHRCIEATAAQGNNSVHLYYDYPKHAKYIKDSLVKEGFTVVGTKVSW